MLTIIILLFLTVTHILASSYVEDGKRAELFEIMDTEVPTFRVTVPKEKFEELKLALQTPPPTVSVFKDEGDEDVSDAVEDNDNVYGVYEFEKIKNATMVVEINGTEKHFNEVVFDIGGSSARLYGRQSFNLIIRDKNKDLYGRSQFRIRPDARDATYLRSKISCDMLNRMGIVSISANYITLYVNEEYFGFYVFMDAPKLPWVEQVYGEKDTNNLYKCKEIGAYLSSQCVNENKEITDNTEWNKFITALDKAQTVEEIEDFFDVDQFLYLAAFDYLVGAWDHFFHLGHNFNIYKNKKTGKWTMVYYDFDSDIGQDPVYIDYLNPHPLTDKNYPHYTVRDWFNLQNHLQEIAVFDNLSRFESILAEVVNNAFNPALLFPHIDELKEFIRPYILHDKTPNESGINPGILNLLNPVDYTMDQWEANSEFTTINHSLTGSNAYGIKYWILERYRAVCNHYNLSCDPVYMDENYQYPIDKKVEGKINVDKWAGMDWSNQNEEPTEVEEPTENEEPIEIGEQTEVEKPIEEPIDKPTKKSKNIIELFNDFINYLANFMNGIFK